MSLKQVLDSMYQDRTLVFAHRGASAYAPMNTLAAFELAVEQGADGIELDVHRSADGHPVILHDFTVDETTDGSGRVSLKTLAELKSLDAGGWFNAQFAGEKIPTLDEVFEVVGQKLYVNVEIKSISVKTDGVEQVVADCIRRHHMQSRVIVSSFNPLSLIRFRDTMPDVATGYLYAPEFPTMPYDLTRKLEYEATHPVYTIVDTVYMDEMKKQGYRINTWTVNNPEDAVRLHKLGVDGIITDRPDVIRNALGL